jgi:hypothetical protein
MDTNVDYTKVMFGQHAVHVPAWLVVQDGGEGLVSFIGGSKVGVESFAAGLHPLRFGSAKTHQLVIGEIIVRPHRVTTSDDRRGSGLAGLATDPFTGLADAEQILNLI